MPELDFPFEELGQSKLVERLSEFFSDSHLDSLARQTKMVQRSTSRLSGKMFVILNSLLIDSLDQTSLADQCEFLDDTYGIRLAKQSLDERYNTDSVRFMRRVFMDLLSKVLIQTNGLSAISSVFNRIYVEDSTSFQLPANLACFYQSAGGSTSNSSVKINLVFELISGALNSCTITDGRAVDSCFLDQKPIEVEPGDLILRDLGYLRYKELSRIHQAGAYFISKYKSQTNLYERLADGRFQKVDLESLLDKVSSPCSRPLFYGKPKVPIRFIITPVSRKRAKRNREKLRKKLAKNPDWKGTPLRWKMCEYHLFLCNFDLQITDQQVLLLYSLRWQIELFFKICKSILQLDKVQRIGNIFRFECFLYGRLIALCLSQNILSLFRQHLLDFDFELSEIKAFRVIKKRPDSS